MICVRETVLADAAISAAVLPETETAGQDTALVSPVIERITRPPSPAMGGRRPHSGSAAFGSRPWPAPQPPWLFTVPGITNKTLRGLMTGLLNSPYSMNQASYDLFRLARNGLIERVPGRNLYTLIRDGLLFLLLHQGLRPRPPPADGTRPAQRTTRTRRCPGYPRPAHRPPHRRGPRPHRSLTPFTASAQRVGRPSPCRQTAARHHSP